MKVETPWGPSQHAFKKADGIVFHSTSGHGGFYLNDERRLVFQNTLPDFECFAGYTRWFEEDCDACAVVIVFAEVFQAAEIYDAIRLARAMAGNTEYGTKWIPVVEYFESQPALVRIENEERERRSTLWERGGLHGGGFVAEFAGHWAVNFSRGSDRRTLMMPAYPDQQLYTDDELSGLTEYQPELHNMRRAIAEQLGAI